MYHLYSTIGLLQFSLAGRVLLLKEKIRYPSILVFCKYIYVPLTHIYGSLLVYGGLQAGRTVISATHNVQHKAGGCCR